MYPGWIKGEGRGGKGGEVRWKEGRGKEMEGEEEGREKDDISSFQIFWLRPWSLLGQSTIANLWRSRES